MNKLLTIHSQRSVMVKGFSTNLQTKETELKGNSKTQWFATGHVLQLGKLKEWHFCNKPPDRMPPARNKLKGTPNRTVTSEPSPISSALSNYQHSQKQLYHF